MSKYRAKTTIRVVGAGETHSFNVIFGKSEKLPILFLPVSNANNFAENDSHHKYERLMILQYKKSHTGLLLSITRYSAIYD